MIPQLETERLILRGFRVDDAPDVQRLAGEWAVADTTTNIPHPYEPGMAEDWIEPHEEAFVLGTLATFAITLKGSGTLVGAIGLGAVEPREKAELGYWVGVPYWGCGYCTEAGRAILAFAFAEMGLKRVDAFHMTRNPASGSVMRKLGMRHEGHFRHHVEKWGVPEDVEFYSIAKTEWANRA